MRKLLAAGACLLSAVLGGSAANSALVVSLDSVTKVSSGYLYTYDILLASGAGLSTSAPNSLNGRSYGSSVTIFDFAGYAPGSITVDSFDTAADAGGSFVASTPLTASADYTLTPGEDDDASIPNLLFTYAGPAFRTTSTGAELAIATVSAISVFDTTGTTSYSGIDVKSANGDAEFFTTTTRGPVGQVPEAATWAMMVMGFGVVGASLRSRRNSTAIVRIG